MISGNLAASIISGPAATGVVVHDNLIGTDITGTLDLGNAIEGVLIDNATDAVDRGRRQGLAGDLGQPGGHRDHGPTSTRNLVQAT